MSAGRGAMPSTSKRWPIPHTSAMPKWSSGGAPTSIPMPLTRLPSKSGSIDSRRGTKPKPAPRHSSSPIRTPALSPDLSLVSRKPSTGAHPKKRLKPDAYDLPSDPEALRAFALACQAELKAAQLSVQLRSLEIEKLKFEIARLRRIQYGRSSERITRRIEQLELRLEELETGAAEETTKAEAEESSAPVAERTKPKRKPLPEHLPRQEMVHEPEGDSACTCPACGAGMAKLGEDVTEVLDYVPGRFQVIRHVRPKYACKACDAITQAPAPAMPTPRGRATPATLAHLLVSKYCDHLPLYRQSEIYARDGVDLDRSTLCDWVGQAAWLLQPIVEGIRRHVFAAEKIHGDDTPVPVLAPGHGKTRTGRLWVYVRDDRPFCGPAPPAAAYFFSPDRGSENPARHMASFSGFLQADGYAGFAALFDQARPGRGPITEVACWAHCRRKFFDVWEATKSPVAKEALDRIGAFYGIEEKARFAPSA